MKQDDRLKYDRFNILVERKTTITETVVVAVDVPTFIKDSMVRKGYAEQLVTSKADELEWLVKDKKESYDIRDNMLVSEAEEHPNNPFLSDTAAGGGGGADMSTTSEPGIHRVDIESGQVVYGTVDGGIRILCLDPKIALKVHRWHNNTAGIQLANAVPELTSDERNKILGMSRD